MITVCHPENVNSEKKVLEKTLEVSRTRKQEISSQIDKIRASAKQRDDDTASFMKNCQELYDAEIKKVKQIITATDKSIIYFEKKIL